MVGVGAGARRVEQPEKANAKSAKLSMFTTNLGALRARSITGRGRFCLNFCVSMHRTVYLLGEFFGYAVHRGEIHHAGSSNAADATEALK